MGKRNFAESLEGADQMPATVADSGRALAFTLLRLRDFRFALLSGAALVFGFEMRAVLQSGLALELTDSQAWVGAISGLPAVTMIALSLLGGVAADRFPKRDIRVLTRLGLVGLALGAGYLVAADVITIWYLLALALVQGSMTAVGLPANLSIVPELVGRENVLTASSLTQALMSIGVILGPALGGFLMGFFGVAPVYFIIGGIQFMAVMASALIRSRKIQSGPGSKSAFSEIADGMRFIRKNTVVRMPMMLNVLSIFAGFLSPLIPVYTRDVLDVGAMGYGLMMATFGLGAAVGTIGLAIAGNVQRKGVLLIGPGVIWAMGTIAFAFSREFYLSLAVLAVMGAAGIVYMTTINAMVQMAIPDDLRGRVTSLFNFTMQLAPLGFIAGGVTAATIGNELALIVSGIGVMLPIVAVCTLSPEFRVLTLRSLG